MRVTKTRRLISLALVVVMAFSMVVTANAKNLVDFDNYKDEESYINSNPWFRDALQMVVDLSIITGKQEAPGAPQTISAADTVSRVEFLVMLYKFVNGGTEPPSVYSKFAYDKFTDAPGWAAEYIGWAVYNGITAGTSETTFSPELTISQNEACVFLTKAVGIEPDKEMIDGSNWSYKYAIIADELGILSRSNPADPNAITRAETAVLFRYALDANIVTYNVNGVREPVYVTAQFPGTNVIRTINQTAIMKFYNAERIDFVIVANNMFNYKGQSVASSANRIKIDYTTNDNGRLTATGGKVTELILPDGAVCPVEDVARSAYIYGQFSTVDGTLIKTWGSYVLTGDTENFNMGDVRTANRPLGSNYAEAGDTTINTLFKSLPKVNVNDVELVDLNSPIFTSSATNTFYNYSSRQYFRHSEAANGGGKLSDNWGGTPVVSGAGFAPSLNKYEPTLSSNIARFVRWQGDDSNSQYRFLFVTDVTIGRVSRYDSDKISVTGMFNNLDISKVICPERELMVGDMVVGHLIGSSNNNNWRIVPGTKLENVQISYTTGTNNDTYVIDGKNYTRYDVKGASIADQIIKGLDQPGTFWVWGDSEDKIGYTDMTAVVNKYAYIQDARTTGFGGSVGFEVYVFSAEDNQGASYEVDTSSVGYNNSYSGVYQVGSSSSYISPVALNNFNTADQLKKTIRAYTIVDGRIRLGQNFGGPIAANTAERGVDGGNLALGEFKANEDRDIVINGSNWFITSSSLFFALDNAWNVRAVYQGRPASFKAVVQEGAADATNGVSVWRAGSTGTTANIGVMTIPNSALTTSANYVWGTGNYRRLTNNSIVFDAYNGTNVETYTTISNVNYADGNGPVTSLPASLPSLENAIIEISVNSAGYVELLRRHPAWIKNPTDFSAKTDDLSQIQYAFRENAIGNVPNFGTEKKWLNGWLVDAYSGLPVGSSSYIGGDLYIMERAVNGVLSKGYTPYLVKMDEDTNYYLRDMNDNWHEITDAAQIGSIVNGTSLKDSLANIKYEAIFNWDPTRVGGAIKEVYIIASSRLPFNQFEYAGDGTTRSIETKSTNSVKNWMNLIQGTKATGAPYVGLNVNTANEEVFLVQNATQFPTDFSFNSAGNVSATATWNVDNNYAMTNGVNLPGVGTVADSRDGFQWHNVEAFEIGYYLRPVSGARIENGVIRFDTYVKQVTIDYRLVSDNGTVKNGVMVFNVNASPADMNVKLDTFLTTAFPTATITGDANFVAGEAANDILISINVPLTDLQSTTGYQLPNKTQIDGFTFDYSNNGKGTASTLNKVAAGYVAPGGDVADGFKIGGANEVYITGKRTNAGDVLFLDYRAIVDNTYYTGIRLIITITE